MKINSYRVPVVTLPPENRCVGIEEGENVSPPPGEMLNPKDKVSLSSAARKLATSPLWVDDLVINAIKQRPPDVLQHITDINNAFDSAVSKSFDRLLAEGKVQLGKYLQTERIEDDKELRELFYKELAKTTSGTAVFEMSKIKILMEKAEKNHDTSSR